MWVTVSQSLTGTPPVKLKKKRSFQVESTLSFKKLTVDLVLNFFSQVNRWLFDSFTDFVTNELD